jgi:hypothetical protein
MLAMRILRILVSRRPRRGDPRLRHGTVGGPMRPPFATTFAVAGHERVRLSLSASRDEPCGACTSGSTCAAAVVPDCSACSCWFDSSGACTPRRRGWQRSERLHGPFGASEIEMVVVIAPRAWEKTPHGAGHQCSARLRG